MDVVSQSAADRIRAEAAGLMVSAQRDDISPDGTLGHWVRSQTSILHALAEATDHIDRTAERLDQRVAATIKNTRDLSISEVQKLQQAVAQAKYEVEQLKISERVLKLQTEVALKSFVDKLTPDLITAIGTITVVKERHWNRRQNWTRVCIVAGVLLGTFAFGYLSGGGNLQSRAAGDAAMTAVLRCREAAQPDWLTGQKWCPVKSLAGEG